MKRSFHRSAVDLPLSGSSPQQICERYLAQSFRSVFATALTIRADVCIYFGRFSRKEALLWTLPL